MKTIRRFVLVMVVTALFLGGFLSNIAYELSRASTTSPVVTPGMDAKFTAEQQLHAEGQLNMLALVVTFKLMELEQRLAPKPASAEPLSILHGVSFAQWLLAYFNRGATAEKKESVGYFFVYMEVPTRHRALFGTDLLRFGPFPTGTPVNGFRGEGWHTYVQVFTPMAGRRLEKITATYNWRPIDPEKAYHMPEYRREKAGDLAAMDTPGYFPIDSESMDAQRGRILNYEFDLYTSGKGSQVVDVVVPILLLPEGQWKAKFLAEERMNELVNSRSTAPVTTDVSGKAPVCIKVVVKEDGLPAEPRVFLETLVVGKPYRIMDGQSIRGEVEPIEANPTRLYCAVNRELAPYVYFTAEIPFQRDGRYGYFDLSKWDPAKPFIITIKGNGRTAGAANTEGGR